MGDDRLSMRLDENHDDRASGVIADGDKVVVLTAVTVDGESAEGADILTYDAADKLVAFEQVGDTSITGRAFPR